MSSTVKTIGITDDIRNAIFRWKADRQLTLRQIAEIAGVRGPTVGKWLDGSIQRINVAYWQNLEAYVQPYVEVGGHLQQVIGGEVSAPQNVRRVPIVGFGHAMGFEPAFEALGDYLETAADSSMAWQDAGQDAFAVRVEGQSMEPLIPSGSLLLVDGGQFPSSGDIVLAKLTGLDEAIVKRYHRRNGIVSLTSINPEGTDIMINLKEEPGHINWIFPVRQMQVDMSALTGRSSAIIGTH